MSYPDDQLCGLCGCTYAGCRLHAELNVGAWKQIHDNVFTDITGKPYIDTDDRRMRMDIVTFAKALLSYRKAVSGTPADICGFCLGGGCGWCNTHADHGPVTGGKPYWPGQS